MKWRLFILTFLLLLLLVNINKVYASNYVAISPSSIELEVNDTFSFQVNASVIGLYGYEFKINFNKTLINVNTITKGSFFPSSNVYEIKKEINNEEGYIWYGIFLLYPETAKSGTGVLLNVEANALAKGNSSLHLYDSKLGTQSAIPIVHSTYDGIINILLEEDGQIIPPGPIEKKVLFDIKITAINYKYILEPFKISRVFTLTINVTNKGNVDGDAIIEYRIKPVNTENIVYNGSLTKYVSLTSISFEKNLELDLESDFISLDVGEYMFYCKVKSVGGLPTDEPAEASMKFTVKNMYVSLIEDNYLIIIPSLVVIIAVITFFVIRRLKRKLKK